jgi:dihydropyrimidinase
MCICMHMLTYLYSCWLQSAQNRLLIKNGKVVNDDGMVDSDVYIEDGVVKWVHFCLGLSAGTEEM